MIPKQTYKVYELSDVLTGLSHQGLAEEPIVVYCGGKMFEIERVMNLDGQLVLVTKNEIEDCNELM